MKTLNEYCYQISSIDEYCKANLINEYLSSKVKINNSFPLEPNHDEIIDFLKSHGFAEAKGEDFSLPDYIIIYAREHKGPFYIDSNSTITFTNGGKIDKDNPVFYCNTRLSDWIKVNYSEWFSGIASQNKDIVYKTYSDFRDRVNTFFGW